MIGIRGWWTRVPAGVRDVVGVAAVMGVFFLVSASTTAVMVVPWLLDGGGMQDPAVNSAIVFGTAIGQCAAVAVVALGRWNLGTVRVGFGLLLLGLLVGLACVGCSVLWELLLTPLLGPPEGQPWAAFALDPSLPTLVILGGLVLMTGLIPLCEELLFRGFLFGIVVSRWGDRTAIAATAIPFALMHGLDPFLLASTGTIGLALAVLRARTGSVWPGVLAHAVNNAIAVTSMWWPEAA